MKTLLLLFGILALSFEGCSSSSNLESSNVPKIKFFLASEASTVSYLSEGDSLKTTLPKLLYSVKPDYPNIAKMARVNGSVLMKAWIDTSGVVQRDIVMRSDADIFNQSVVDAVIRWKFSPLIYRGVVSPCWSEIPISFENGNITMPQ